MSHRAGAYTKWQEAIGTEGALTLLEGDPSLGRGLFTAEAGGGTAGFLSTSQGQATSLWVGWGLAWGWG